MIDHSVSDKSKRAIKPPFGSLGSLRIIGDRGLSAEPSAGGQRLTFILRRANAYDILTVIVRSAASIT
jgi:hypothetical protein